MIGHIPCLSRDNMEEEAWKGQTLIKELDKIRKNYKNQQKQRIKRNIK